VGYSAGLNNKLKNMKKSIFAVIAVVCVAALIFLAYRFAPNAQRNAKSDTLRGIANPNAAGS